MSTLPPLSPFYPTAYSLPVAGTPAGFGRLGAVSLPARPRVDQVDWSVELAGGPSPEPRTALIQRLKGEIASGSYERTMGDKIDAVAPHLLRDIEG